MRKKKLAPLYLILFISGCAAHTSLEPLGEGQARVHTSLGGPVVSVFDTWLPIPYSTVGVDYGLRERVDGNVALHLLPLGYKIAAFDAGATWYPNLFDDQPVIGLQARMLAMASLRDNVDSRTRFLPWVTATAAWPKGRKLLYTGLNLALPLNQSDYDDDAAPVIVSPFAGIRWPLSRNLALITELKWQGANLPTDQLAADYLYLGRQGAVTPLFTLQWTPGEGGR